MIFNFKTFWDSDTLVEQAKTATIMVDALIGHGYPRITAVAMVEKFQHNAFEDGEYEESYNNCGEDA